LEAEETAAERSEAEHKNGSEDYAKGGERDWRKVAESDFDYEEIVGPDGHDECDGNDQGGARWCGARRGGYAHGRLGDIGKDYTG
jgi:hypothetical protein